jgi:hypothetical protein
LQTVIQKLLRVAGAVLFICASAVLIGFMPALGTPKIPVVYDILYGGPRWWAAIALLVGAPIFGAAALGYRWFAKNRAISQLDPPGAVYRVAKVAIYGTLIIAWGLVLAMLLTFDFGN